jgi:uncharacterized protein (TIGR02301 family)
MPSTARLAGIVALALLLPAIAAAQQQPSTNTPAPQPPASAPAVAAPVTEGAAPPPYQDDLLRLAEILGAIHYLRPLCGFDGNQWREQMEQLLDSESADEPARTRMVDRFNRGYDSYKSVYLSCTPAATLAAQRYLEEGARIAADITARYGR